MNALDATQTIEITRYATDCDGSYERTEIVNDGSTIEEFYANELKSAAEFGTSEIVKVKRTRVGYTGPNFLAAFTVVSDYGMGEGSSTTYRRLS